MRRIARHAKYRAKRSELAKKYLVEDESIPPMRVFHASDDEEVRMLAIVPVEAADVRRS
ncbi:MAG: hypothetical protein IID44_30645 [Planctomycetes bacterium]|nr:hypothetical protein [Planctomycetota bacterium]